MKNITKTITGILWTLGTVLTAYLLGYAVCALIGMKMTTYRDMIISPKVKQEAVVKKTLSDYEREIGELFGNAQKMEKAKKEKNKEDETSPDDPAGSIDWDQAITAGSGKIQLTGTIIGSDMALAFLNVDGTDVSVRIGQQVGGYEVDSIMKNTVHFKKSGQETVLSMDLDETAPVVSEKRARINALVEKDKQKEEEIDDMVTDSGDKKVVDRRKFNALLTPPSRLANDMKFIPNAKDGKPYGIKVSYLKPNSLFVKMGLQAGDILVKTNNKDIQSVEDSFTAYQAFRNEDHVTLEVDRGGQIVQIPIEFR